MPALPTPSPLIAAAGSSERWDRASPVDLMQLASDVGPAPMQVGAVLLLRPGREFDVPAAQRLIGERIAAVPRLRQRLVRPPLGCGRPVWVDDARFDLRHHVGSVRCPAPGDPAALLEVAAAVLTRRLNPSRPLWAATFVTDLAGGAVAVVVVFHHVLADGIGGLAVLAHLVDGMPAAGPVPFPGAAPSSVELAVDAWRGRWRAATGLPALVRRLRHTLIELGAGAGRVRRVPRTSLNRPTGPRRRLALARADLAAVHAAAHARGATVNDAVLSAVVGALHTLLACRGEHIGSLVVSVPVSSRAAASATRLGNHTGVMPVALPTTVDPGQRLAAVAAVTRARKNSVAGASAALLGPVLRLLAAVGVLRRLIDRQRLVNTFVTNLRGPTGRLSLCGVTVDEIIPITTTTGNVTVAFAVLSYAGALAITIVVDPDRCPDVPALARAVQAELDTLAAAGRQQPCLDRDGPAPSAMRRTPAVRSGCHNA